MHFPAVCFRVGINAANPIPHLRKVTFMCKTCNKTYSTPGKLRKHLRDIKVAVIFFCTLCDQFAGKNHPPHSCNFLGTRCSHCNQLLEPNNTRLHLCFHKLAAQMFCKYCQMTFYDVEEKSHLCSNKSVIEENLKMENIEYLRDDRYLCKICNGTYTLPEVVKHLKIGVNDCEFCCRAFNSTDELMKHLDEISTTLIYFCRQCVRLCKEGEHEKTSECPNTFLIAYCAVCQKTIKQEDPKEHLCFHTVSAEVQQEMQENTLNDCNNFLYTCEFCGKMLPITLKHDHYTLFHKSSERKNIERTCSLCNFVSKNIVEHRKHRLAFHSDVLCHICGKRLKVAKIKAHIQSHGGIKPHKCEQCGKLFTHKAALRKHWLVHTNITKYACGTCEKRFKNKFNLGVHMRIHSDVKPFECVVCKKTFTTKQWRDNHLKTHNVVGGPVA